ncbi:NFX1-type zinc finger-containing protein 1-like [Saccostrea echinata]|uniref:NFX1-type zinc finger-containing protein 1-like n=1 Tax=Saccostrea echinata TaxID=191078 RepID=UPI002A82B197|nr:NFX1-type zinc finger-containing protein 1-like [Saccostrea echinata]
MDIENYFTKPLRLADLKTLLSYKVEDILSSGLWTEDKVRATLRKTEQDLEECKLFLQIVVNVLENKRCAEKPQVLSLIPVLESSNFAKNLQTIIRHVSTEKNLPELENIVCFLSHLCKRSPTTAHGFIELFKETEDKINVLIAERNVEEDEHLLDLGDEIKLLKDIITDHSIRPEEQGKCHKKDTRKPPNNFREMSILPTLDDIHKIPFFRPNLRDVPFDNLDEYLDIQFRLLREDCIAQLRSGIIEYLCAKHLEKKEIRKLQDARLYRNVTIEEEKEMTLDGPMYTIRLDMNQVKRIRWERSNRLMYGSLLCISPNDFKSLYFGIIAETDNEVLQRKGTIKVLIKRQKGTPELSKGLIVTVVESVAYFEAYRHVLHCLQSIKEGEMPFERYIVHCQRDIKKPKYLTGLDDVKYDLQPIVSQSVIFQAKEKSMLQKYRPLQRRSLVVRNQEKRTEISIFNKMKWPRASDLRLDKSQYEAFKSALTKEFVLIQGPPGTGKTHLGLRIAKTLLHNSAYWKRKDDSDNDDEEAKGKQKKEKIHPMLIVCYTNHALDQFLEGMIDFMDPTNRGDWSQNIVRVGGRCNSEKIEDFKLKNRRRSFRKVFVNHGKFEKQLQDIHMQICRLKWNIFCAQENILDETILSSSVKEVKRIIEHETQAGKTFKMMEWLNVNEGYFTEAAFEKYEKTDGDDVVDLKETIDAEEVIDVETEGDHVKNERMIEEDDFDVEYNFKAVGVSIESILLESKSKPNLSEDFMKYLDNEASIVNNYFQKSKAMTGTEMRLKINDVWSMPIQDRWRMYKYFVEKYCDVQTKELNEQTAKYDKIYKDYLVEKNYVDREILSSSLVIAMTTTGAARYQTVLNEIGPKIIIVEEAAEVLEGHIISTLSTQCEHLILIGDHKQLEPKPSVYELAERYNLALSMFERMIENKLEFNCLMRQHRMRPEISKLVQDIYPGLEDDDTVFNRDHVLGIEKDVYFISHTNNEYQKGESQSYSNEFEALYIKRLTRYLLQQGYKRQDITILTPYSGQMFCIRDLMPKNEFAGIRISILDNYQGEENDIILLSLVRSNKEGRIGFLKKENRICVALSRAKIGLYVIGNFKMIEKFTRKTNLLRSAIDKMKKSGALGDGLPLFCQNHPGTQRIYAKTPDDFDKAPEGGCILPCNFELNCGHTCTHLCHPYDKEHLDITCRDRCEKICERGHTCQKICHFPKPCKCRVKVEKDLQCGHTVDLPCFQDPETYKCLVIVNKMLNCGHSADMPCWTPIKMFECQRKVTRTLPCKHSIELLCCIDYELYKCQEKVSRILPKCEHEVEMKCFENVKTFKCPTEVVEKRNDCEHDFTRACHISSLLFQVRNKCSVIVCKTFPSCGHSVEVECHVSLQDLGCKSIVYTNFKCHHSNIQVQCYKKDKTKCDSPCGLLCPVGHECLRKCHFNEKCLCEKVVEKKHPLCGHLLTLKCFENAAEKKCLFNTVKSLKCGHTKETACYIEISQIKCKEMVKKILNCGHEKELHCYKDINSSDVKCQSNVEKTLSCGHVQVMKCCDKPSEKKCTERIKKELLCTHEQETECWRNISTVQCKSSVTKTLRCGHLMSMKCWESPHKKKCTELVEITQFECNHVNKIPCHLNQELQANPNMELPPCTANVTRTEVCGHDVTNPCMQPYKNVCREKCTYVLACGHLCTGDCTKCNGGLLHQTCNKMCKNRLICGHDCGSKRCGDCYACDKQCMARCSHKTCKNICNQPCNQCTEPCEWQCPHFTCTLLCHEPCYRPRCNKQCPKVLSCGHKCAAFCGEPCIQNCLECNPSREAKLNKKIGLVQLQLCGHIFTANELDAIFDSEKNDILTVLRCPSCKKAVIYHPRYNEILKKQAQLVNMMKSQLRMVMQLGGTTSYPFLFGDRKECVKYLTEFGTFISAFERKLEKAEADNLRRSQFCIEVLLNILNSDSLLNYQNAIDIYRGMAFVSYIWKLLAIKLAENDIVKSQCDKEMSDEKRSTVNEVSDNQDLVTAEKVEETITSLVRFVKCPGKISTSQQKNIEKCINCVRPVLTQQVASRIGKAEGFPKPMGIIDCHIDKWTLCKNGHPFCQYDDYQTCFTCQDVKAMFKYPFCLPSTFSNNYENQGARPKQDRLNDNVNITSSSSSNTNVAHVKHQMDRKGKSEIAERYGASELNTRLEAKNEPRGNRGKRRNRREKSSKHRHQYEKQTEPNVDFESMIEDIAQTEDSIREVPYKRNPRQGKKRGSHNVSVFQQHSHQDNSYIEENANDFEFPNENFSRQRGRNQRGWRGGRGRGQRGRGRKTRPN